MTTIYDVDVGELIPQVAKQLKEQKLVAPPEWAKFVKTGVHKERPPVDQDWWYVRAAAVLRTVYRQGPIGVSKLRTKYGGKQNTGYKPEHQYKGSGSVARKVLQQLEKSGLIKQEQRGIHKGRVITPKGKSLLDKAASHISKSSGKPGVQVGAKEQPAAQEKPAKQEKPATAPEKAHPAAEEKPVPAQENPEPRQAS
ncbi:MAG: small subunit ribosomal protein S19e [archaeon GW2011_AR11]|nr:MAG: small subunit ribosomal protein S19e [archaeon GW2011_AR11]